MSIKLIFFDLDGTLVDSLKDLTASLNFVMNKYGFDPYTEDDVKKFIGSGARELIRKSFLSKNVSVSEALKLFITHYTDNCTVNTGPYEGVVETLEKLETINIVLTNKPLVMSEKIIDALDLRKFFREIISPESFNVKKPDPLPVNAILEKYGITKEEAIMIGDSSVDVECGKLAGIRVITVNYGFADIEEIKESYKIIKNFKDILNIIKS